VGIRGWFRIASETVVTWTPAALATSASVVRRDGWFIRTNKTRRHYLQVYC
jgi:hypothetical protein